MAAVGGVSEPHPSEPSQSCPDTMGIDVSLVSVIIGGAARIPQGLHAMCTGPFEDV